MSGAEESHLSVCQNGYDFVVASTQQCLNTALKEFFDKFGQLPVEVCFIVDSNGAIAETITLAELKARSGGVDPFTIPHGADWNEERIQALFNVRFMVGFQFQIGLPGPPSEYKELPDIIELGENARNIGFHLMSKELIIVINKPPGGWGTKGVTNKIENKIRSFPPHNSLDPGTARSRSATSSWPVSAAHDNDVLSPAFGSTHGSPSSTLTTSLWPFVAAYDNGVFPFPLWVFGSTRRSASSRLTTASWPFSAAHDSGVCRFIFWEFGSIRGSASSRRTIASWPFPAAPDSDDPKSKPGSTHRSSSSRLTIASWPFSAASNSARPKPAFGLTR